MPPQLNWRQAADALVSAFPTYADLRRMLMFGLRQSLDRIVSNSASLDEAAFQLLQWGEAAGRTDELIVAARNEQPKNSKLRAVAEDLLVAPSSRLESVFSPGTALPHIEVFRMKLSECELPVCRIEIKGEGNGTGFLVGPSLVMTSFHVVDGARASDIIARFDYKLGSDKRRLSPGVTYATSQRGLVFSSPTNELDYAIIELSKPAGDEPVAGQEAAPPRKWLTPVARNLRPIENLLIIQHPDATPMKLGFGKVSKVCDSDRLVCHNADTLPGSSGSPCFTMDWELVALHRQGLDTNGPCEQNAAINLARVLAREEVLKLLS